jgi:hypothetical protein
MRALFTFLQLLLAATCAIAQVPVVEQAYIATKVVITDAEGNTIPASKIAPRLPEGVAMPSVPTNSRVFVVQGYMPGHACTFTSETWYKEGSTHVTARYFDRYYTNIRDKEGQQYLSYSELINPQAAMQVLSPSNEPVRFRSTGSLSFSTGTYITDAELAEQQAIMKSKASSMEVAWPLLDTTGAQLKVLLQDVEQELAGYRCKRAIISLVRNDSLLLQIKAWYNTEVRLPELSATGNPFDASFNLMNNRPPQFYALAQLPGLAMSYEMPDLLGNTITVEVTKLKTNKKPGKRYFRAPSSVIMRSFSEMRAMSVRLMD